ncbi:MAG: metal ABC transporter ATP-binding protein [Pyrobaculum sp.]
MLKISHVTVERGGAPVLEDVTFEAGREFILVVGPNGAGKTTLFLAILGLLPHRGEICIDGVCGPERSRKVGYVPQYLKAEVNATVWEYVYLPTKFRKLKNGAEAAEAALKFVDMYHKRDQPLTSLSGGEFQRAAVARALAVGGDVLLLDEPLANVDPQGRVELLTLLKELKRDRAVLMTSHDLTLPSDLADRVLILKKRLIAYGPPDYVLREDVLSKVYRYVRVAKTAAGYVCVTEDLGHHY